jgi:membrane associated rhomboid family serine protease
LIPFRDTLDVKGPVVVTLVLMLANLVLWIAGEIPHLNLVQLLLALAGLWLFGAYIERRFGSPAFLAIYLALAIPTGFLVAAVDDRAGIFAVSLFLPVLLLGALHLALAPRSRILVLVPVPFAMTFFEVPTLAMLIGWLALEMLLTAI